MEFTLYGFEVNSSEVDDRGIDFVLRKDNRSITTFRLNRLEV